MTLAVLLTLAASTSFVIEPPACPPDWFDAPALESMLLADTSSVGRVYVAVIVPRCERPELQVAVLRAGRPPRQADVSLDGVPEALALRTVALTVADLLDGAELAPPLEPIVPTTTELEPERTPASLRLEAAGELGVYPGITSVLYGANVRLDARPWSNLHTALGARWMTTRQEEAFGEARLTLVTAEAIVGVAADGAGFEWGAGAHVDGGWVGLTGATGRHRRAVLRAAIALSVRRALPYDLDLSVELRPGATIRGVRGVAGDAESVGADGAFVDVRFALGYRIGEW